MPNNNTLNTAIDLGVLEGEIAPIVGVVDPTDRNDFYRFTLEQNSDVNFGLLGLGPEPAQLQIVADVNGDGEFSRFDDVIEDDTVSNTSSSTADRFISTPLSAGIYWARVVTWYDSQNSGYTLTAQAVPRTNDVVTDPGNTFDTALDMGEWH